MDVVVINNPEKDIENNITVSTLSGGSVLSSNAT